MTGNIEFFVGIDGIDIVYRTMDGKYNILCEENADIIFYMYNRIKTDYPEAFQALIKVYSKSPNFQYLLVRRFIKCNFSVLDERLDVQHDGSMRLEFVNCPLRGECQHDGIICNPKFCNTLSKRELKL